MNILGLSFDYHDAAAAMVVDGEVVAAIQEERLSRRKNDPGFPERAIAECLKIAGLKVADIDHVAYYELPLLKFGRILTAVRRTLPRSRGYLLNTMKSWFRGGKFDAAGKISEKLGIDRTRVICVRHHDAHAASAFFSSPFERATVVTLDGVGEYETATVSVGEGNAIRRIMSLDYPHSIGLLYSAFTGFLGFEVNEGEYKVMGMAGFGEPVFVDRFRDIISSKDGRFAVNQELFDFYVPTGQFFNDKIVERFGPPRPPESPFQIPLRGQAAADGSVEAVSLHYANVAASLQRAVEEVILDVVGSAVQRTGITNVAMAGGVSLNSLANGRLQRELGVRLFVQPAAGDAGSALGAAQLIAARRQPHRRPKPLQTASLGVSYGEEEVRAALGQLGLSAFDVFDSLDALIAHTADLLAEGAVVGWFQERFEWGPRALGHRSIIANPCIASMQQTINEKIKFREPFRPFAPAVLAENATEFFDVAAPVDAAVPESYMLSVHRVRDDARARIPAVTHVDGTARVQFVWKQPNTGFRRLIEAFGARTGTPVLLNTSFNRRGEPIVASPADAMKTFSWSGLDYLAIDKFLVRKAAIL